MDKISLHTNLLNPLIYISKHTKKFAATGGTIDK